MAVKIITLGTFDILMGERSVLKRSKRGLKSLELLKFFIAHRHRKLLPENIIEDLWPDTDADDPKNALRIQIFRMRKDLQKMGITGQGDGNIDITYENGYYVMKVDGCVIDADLFEEKIRNADLYRSSQPDKAIEIYEEAIGIYPGDFLEENLYSEWAFPMRSHYHRLYVQSLLRLLALLKERRKYEEIVGIYEGAVLIEPFEEALHLYFLEALVELREFKNALSHYNYITNRMYRELSVSPTDPMKSVYKKILSGGEKPRSRELTDIGKDLVSGDKVEGALFCDADHFKSIYHLERRRKLRSDHSAFLGLVSVMAGDNILLNDEEPLINNPLINNYLINPLMKSLRKGDVFSQWNERQMVILLTDVSEVNLQLISARIKRKFLDEIQSDEFTLHINFQSVAAEKSFIL